MVIQFFKKICFNLGTFGTLYLSLYILLKSWSNSPDLRDLWDFIYMAIYFFKKIILLDLVIFGTLETSYLSLWILLKIWNNSWDLRDLIYMAIYFLKKLFEFRDLQDLRDLICISVDLTKKLD